jgi:hypothetical protein
MSTCRFLERYPTLTVPEGGRDFIESERCRLGNEIHLDGCPENCPDFEPLGTTASQPIIGGEE